MRRTSKFRLPGHDLNSSPRAGEEIFLEELRNCILYKKISSTRICSMYFSQILKRSTHQQITSPVKGILQKYLST